MVQLQFAFVFVLYLHLCFLFVYWSSICICICWMQRKGCGTDGIQRAAIQLPPASSTFQLNPPPHPFSQQPEKLSSCQCTFSCRELWAATWPIMTNCAYIGFLLHLLWTTSVLKMKFYLVWFKWKHILLPNISCKVVRIPRWWDGAVRQARKRTDVTDAPTNKTKHGGNATRNKSKVPIMK